VSVQKQVKVIEVQLHSDPFNIQDSAGQLIQPTVSPLQFLETSSLSTVAVAENLVTPDVAQPHEELHDSHLTADRMDSTSVVCFQQPGTSKRKSTVASP